MNLAGRRVILVFLVVVLAILLAGWYIIQTRSSRREPLDARLVCPLIREGETVDRLMQGV